MFWTVKIFISANSRMVRLLCLPNMNTLHRKISSNQYFQNGAAIIDPVCPQNVPLTPISLPPQQTVLELTDIHETLTECV